MEDRELLELAAKAVGHDLYDHTILGDGVWVYGEGQSKLEDGRSIFFWSPLTDDGDALRLAVKLNLSAKRYGDLIEVVGPKGPSFAILAEQGVRGGDLAADYRLAFARAAAEIGKAMQEQSK